jgi:hypothetical protein
VFSHSGLYLVLAKANKIVFLSVIISALSQYNLLNQKTMKKLVLSFRSFYVRQLHLLRRRAIVWRHEKCYFLQLLRDLSRHRITYERIVSEYVSLEVGVDYQVLVLGLKYFSAKSKSKK